MDILETDKTVVCKLLSDYLHSSYCYEKQNPDGSWTRIQPGFPNAIVKKYYVYFDKDFAYNHKTWRIMVIFDDNTEHEISLYKFKRYIRKRICQNPRLRVNMRVII